MPIIDAQTDGFTQRWLELLRAPPAIDSRLRALAVDLPWVLLELDAL